jgi:hypothetical protein
MLLVIDAVINLLLGALLLWFPDWLVAALGVPPAGSRFYPGILGAVLVGIGIALLVEWSRRGDRMVGLGLGGAISINLTGGVVLAVWLLFGRLDLPLRGWVFLWALVLLLVGLSTCELAAALAERRLPPQQSSDSPSK